MRATWQALAAVLALCPHAIADDLPFRVVVAHEGSDVNDRYCGLYCVHHAAKLVGRGVDLNQLFRPDRLSGKYGSTVTDIESACRDSGIEAWTVPSATYADLCLLGAPAIVLVKNSPDAPTPNHWVLVLSADAGSAEVFDPGVGVIRLAAAELQSLWGGPAVLVLAPGDTPAASVLWSGYRIALTSTLAGASALLLAGALRVGLHPLLAVLGVCVGLSVAVHGFSPAGFARNMETVRQIESARRPRTLDSVTPADVLKPHTSTTVVDARTPNQYRAARIPGSINVPVTAPYRRNQQAIAAVPRDTRVVIYCNSEDCHWAEDLGRSSLFRVYPHVAVLTEGLAGYLAAGGKRESGNPQRGNTR